MCLENFPFFRPSLLMTRNLQDHFSFMNYEFWILLVGKFSPVKKRVKSTNMLQDGWTKLTLILHIKSCWDQWFSCGKLLQLGEFCLSENETENQKFVKFRVFLGPVFEIKIIKLVPSRPRHFLGHHLWQHFVNLLQPTHLG